MTQPQFATLKRMLHIATVLLLAPLSLLQAAERTNAPNILFILTDDHALEGIGAYDSWLKDYVQTPTLDRLAAEGMRFNNLCCNDSICSPSRASILTGQYNHKNGVPNLGGSINDASPVFSEELKKVGYQTCVIGKWHLSSKPRGFDHHMLVKGQGSYFDPHFVDTPTGPQKFKGYYADIYTDQALAWVRKRDKSKPFALCLQFKGPHFSYEYPERHENLLADVVVPEPPTLHEDNAKTSPLLKSKIPQQMADYYHRMLKDKRVPMWPAGSDVKSQTSAAYQHMIHKYIRCVAAIDDNIKRVLDQLTEEGVLDDTLVVYTSDQGYWLGQHGLYDKRFILEESLKMPLIVRYPKLVKPGSVDTHMCSNVDVAPTLLEFAGAPVPDAVQGRSLLPLLRGESPTDWRSTIWYAYWSDPPHWGIRTAHSTLVRFPGTDEIEFYDRKADPLQERSVHADPAYAERIAAAQKLLIATMKEVDIQKSELPVKKQVNQRRQKRQKKSASTK